MIAEKYPRINDLSEIYNNIELSHVGKGEYRVPVAVVQSWNYMALLWWNPKEQAWNSHTWEVPRHSSYRWDSGSNTGPTNVSESYGWNYSLTTGLACDTSQAFVCYKSNRGILVRHFNWDGPNYTFKPTNDEPANIPVPGYKYEGGMAIKAWISQSINRLLVLGQTFPDDPDGLPSLTLFRFDLEHDTTPTNLISVYFWDAIDLLNGGYDFDAYFLDPVIHIVHKHFPYLLSLEFEGYEDGSNEIPVDQIPEDRYLPLEYFLYDVNANDLQQQMTLTGGEHPQIQSLSPLRISADRPRDGTFLIEQTEVEITLPGPNGSTTTSTSYQKTFSTKIGHMEKILLEYDQQQGIWRKGSLLIFNPYFKPMVCSERIQEQVLVTEDEIFWGSLFPIKPVYLIRTDEITNAKEETLMAMHHMVERGTLLAEGINILHSGNKLEISDPHHVLVLDVNHQQMPCLDDLEPDTTPENFQFLPLEEEGGKDEHGSGLFIHQKPLYRNSNTIGGLLSVDRYGPPLSYYAYVDYGDVGLRVVHDEDFVFPAPVEVDRGHNYHLGAFSGPGISEDFWVEMTFPAAGWTHYNLPGYRVDSSPILGNSIPSGIQLQLTQAIPWYGSRVLNDQVPWANSVPNGNQINQLWQGVWNNLWGVLRSINGDPDPNDEDAEESNQAFRVLDSTLTLDTSSLIYAHDDNGEPDTITIDIDEEADHQGQISCIGQHRSQGRVRFRLPIEFSSENITTNFDNIFYVREITAQVFYGRDYSPCVLTSDTRRTDILMNEEITPAETVSTKVGGALAAKPVGDSFLDSGLINVDCDWTILGRITALGLLFFANIILALLGAFGLGIVQGSVKSMLVALGAAVAAAFVTGLGWIGVFILVGEILLVLWGVPRLIASEIRNSIRNSINPQDEYQISMKEHLDAQNILSYAGEGIAEALARQALDRAVRDGNLPESQGASEDPLGKDRQRRQFWQMIYVRDNLCRILIRPNND